MIDEVTSWLPTTVDRTWSGAVNNQWFTPGNWEPAGPPASRDNLSVLSGLPRTTSAVAADDGGSITVSSWAASASFARFHVGDTTTGSLSVLDGGEVSNTYGEIGSAAGSHGTATVAGAGSTWSNSVSLYVGLSGTGSLGIQDGGEVSSALSVYIARNSGSAGTVTVEGTGSTFTGGGSLYVGGSGSSAGGTGELTVRNGGKVDVANTLKLWISSTFNLSGGEVNTGSFEKAAGGTFNFTGGVLTVDGGTCDLGFIDFSLDGSDNPTLTLTNGATATLPADLNVGNNDTGTLNILNGAEVSNSYGRIGFGSSSQGTVTVDGTGSTWTVDDELFVGYLGAGSLTIRNGGAVSNLWSGYVGYRSHSDNSVMVDGTNSTWTTSAWLSVGCEGKGSLIIQNGGAVSNSLSAYIGRFSGSQGSVTVSGTGATWTNSSSLYVGGAGSLGGPGELTVAENGTVDVSDTLKVWNTGTVNLHHATIIAGEVELDAGATFNSGAGSTLRVNTLSGFGNNPSFGGNLEIGHAGGSGSGSHVVAAAQSLQTGDSLTVGYDAVGSLLVEDGGVVSSANSSIAVTSGSDGTATVSGTGSTWTNSGTLYVGGSEWTVGGTASLSVGTGGTVNVGGELKIGDEGTVNLVGGMIQAGSFRLGNGTFNFNYGTLTVDGGVFHNGSTPDLSINGGTDLVRPMLRLVGGADATIANKVTIGDSRRGALEILGGSDLESGSGQIGRGEGSAGTVTVSDPDSSWINRSSVFDPGLGPLTIANQGTGTLNITNGGLVSNTFGYVAYASGSTGGVTVSGPGSTWINRTSVTQPFEGDLTIGKEGSGSLDISGRGEVSNNNGYIAAQDGSKGIVTVSGKGSTWTNSGWLFVGGTVKAAGGTATLRVGAGATVNVEGVLRIWDHGTVNLDGGTINTGRLATADSGFKFSAGTLNITNSDLTIGPGGPLGSTLELGPGKHVNVMNNAVVDPSALLRVQDNASFRTSLVLTNNGQIQLDGTPALLRADGELANHGTINFGDGFAHLRGKVRNYHGGNIAVSGGSTATFHDDLHSDGQLQIGSGCKAVFFGEFSGTGGTVGPGTAQIEGELRPGNGPVKIAFGGDLMFGSTAGLEIELAGPTHDMVNVAGGVRLGGTLTLVPIDVGNPGSTSPTIITAAGDGGVSGKFTNVPPVHDPAVGPAGYLGLGVFHRGVNYVDGVVASVTVNLFTAKGGDGNGDGYVDVQDINTLVANFGADPGNMGWTDGDTAGGDANRGDGYVDVQDINILVANFGAHPDPGPVGSGDLWLGEGRTSGAISNAQSDSFIVIPEPSTVALAVIGVLMLLTYARWKRRPAWTRLPQLPQ